MKYISMIVLLFFSLSSFCQLTDSKHLLYSRMLPDSITEERIILQISKNNVCAILENYDSQIYKHSYFVGNVDGNVITGNVIYETFEGNKTKYYQNKFSIEISSDSSKMTIYKMNENGQKSKGGEYSINQFRDYGLAPDEGLFLKELPSMDSKSILKLDMLKLFQKKEIEFIEIGKIGYIENKVNFWHKVKIKNQIGWVFGVFDLFQDRYILD